MLDICSERFAKCNALQHGYLEMGCKRVGRHVMPYMLFICVRGVHAATPPEANRSQMPVYNFGMNMGVFFFHC